MPLLEGKRALILGVASNRSIAWGIARAMRREGADLAFTFQNERLGNRVAKLAAEAGSGIVLECDVASDSAIDGAFEELRQHWDGLDVVVHAIAFAPREALQGDYLESLTREAHAIAHDVSAYSFAALAKAARPMMQGRNGGPVDPHLSRRGAGNRELQRDGCGEGESGSERALRRGGTGARGDPGERHLGRADQDAGCGRASQISGGSSNRSRTYPRYAANVTIDDVGNVAAFLCSDLAAGITGEVVPVDAGFSMMGMAMP